MVTQFGKFLRKIRIDNSELLKNMADTFGVTSSYLSAVENGKRNIPQDWASKIIEFYDLTDNQIIELDEAIALSQNEIILDTSELDTSDKKFLAAFAREFTSLDDTEKDQIKNIFLKNMRGWCDE